MQVATVYKIIKGDLKININLMTDDPLGLGPIEVDQSDASNFQRANRRGATRRDTTRACASSYSKLKNASVEPAQTSVDDMANIEATFDRIVRTTLEPFIQRGLNFLTINLAKSKILENLLANNLVSQVHVETQESPNSTTFRTSISVIGRTESLAMNISIPSP